MSRDCIRKSKTAAPEQFDLFEDVPSRKPDVRVRVLEWSAWHDASGCPVAFLRHAVVIDDGRPKVIERAREIIIYSPEYL